MWTREAIQIILETNTKAVERGIVRIYERQTEDEQQSDNTKHSNSRGFNAADAKYGSYLARWVIGGRHLSGKHLAKAREMTIRYSGQLADLANQKSSTIEANKAKTEK